MQMLTLMVFHKMTPQQTHAGRPIGTDTTQERSYSPIFKQDVFVNAVEIMEEKTNIQSHMITVSLSTNKFMTGVLDIKDITSV